MVGGLELIPGERRQAAYAALTEVFGRQPLGDLRLLTGGVSGAAIWRIDVGGEPYVLRLEPERIAVEHRERGYACMRAAAAASVAPKLLYADAGAGVAIMAFVEGRPLAEHPGGSAGVVRDLGRLIARLQGAVSFPSFGGGADLVADLLERLRLSGLFEPGLLDRHAEGLARIREAYPWDPAAFVSSHNDPNPRNILFDGQRLWLVDWELGSANDPFFDPAIATMELATTPELEDVLLAALGRPVDAATKARLAVVRLLARLFYGCIALEAFADETQPAPRTSLAGLTPAAFLNGVGQMSSGDEIAWAFGTMSLRAFVDGVSEPGFGETLNAARPSG